MIQYQQELRTQESPPIFQKLLIFCSIKLGLCHFSDHEDIFRVNPKEEMLEIKIKKSDIPKSILMFFNLENPSIFAKTNPYVGHDQVAMIVYCMLGRPQDCSPSAILKRNGSFVQIQPCSSSVLAKDSLRTLLMDGSPNQLPFDKYLWMMSSGIVLGVYDDHASNSSVVEGVNSHPSLSRFDHKCIGTHPDSLLLFEDGDEKVQYYIPFKTFLLQSSQRDEVIPEPLCEQLQAGLQDVVLFFDTFPSKTPFFNRIKEHSLCVADRLLTFLKSDLTKTPLALVNVAYPSSSQMLEMIFKIYQPKSSFSLYSNLFDLTNTPIPVLISYFHAHKCSQSSMTKALALLLTPVDVNTDIDDTIRKMVGDVIQTLEAITHDDVRTNTPVFKGVVHTIHQLIEDVQTFITESSTDCISPLLRVISVDAEEMFADEAPCVGESTLLKQSSSTSIPVPASANSRSSSESDSPLQFPPRQSSSSWSSESSGSSSDSDEDDIVFA